MPVTDPAAEAAAHVVDVATQAAAARERLAAFEAAALVDVASATQASALPHILDRLDALSDGLSEVKQEIVAVGSTAERTLVQATKTNGRVTVTEERLDAIDLATKLSDAEAEGRRAQRKDDVAKIDAVKTFGTDYLPWIGMVGFGALSVFLFIWSHAPW